MLRQDGRVCEGSMQAAAIDVAVESDSDAEWARRNLRHSKDGRPYLDLANCLRIIELHPDYKGRYRYNEVLNKVLDKGTVMIEWRMSEFAAILQERFMPDVPFEIAARALVIAANRAGAK